MNPFFSSNPIGLQKGIVVVRFITGCFLLYHGCELFVAAKIRDYQQWSWFQSALGYMLVYVGKLAELLAGILLAIGFLTRIACTLIAAVMSYITFYLGSGIVWYNDQHPFLFVMLALLLFCTGPGKWSLDAVLFDVKKF